MSPKAFELAFLEMAKAFDWPSIRSQLISGLINEDIADAAIIIAMEKWEPFRETDWSQPGLKLAKGIAYNLMRGGAEYYEENLNLEDSGSGPEDIAGKVKPDKLAETIDNWLFDNCPHKLAATFIFDIVYGVGFVECGMIASEEERDTHKAYYDFWYRTRSDIKDRLKKYLDNNENLYCL